MNNKIFHFFYSFAHQSILLDNIIIFFAVYLPILIVVSAGIFLLIHHEVMSASRPIQAFKQRWQEIVLVFFSGCFAWVIATILKSLFHIPRPFNALPNVQSLFVESGFAFPSGHATFFMALAMAIFFSHKKAGYVFILLAIVIGIARIAGGVHFPIDILGGFVLGALVAYLLKNV